MVSREAVQKILEAGVQAPSGSGSEPWRFEVSNGAVSVFMLPEKDHPILNVNQWGTIFATGALLENISVAAAHYGFEAAINFFPAAENRNLVADVSFAEKSGRSNGSEPEPDLFGAIFRRATDRKPYGTEKIDGAVRRTLLGAPADVGAYDVVLKLVDDRGQIGTLATAASANDRIASGNKALRELFFEETAWAEPRPKSFWPWPPRAAGDSAKAYAACSFYGGVLCEPTDIGVARAGQVVERAWLAATAMGLSFHLQAGINFLRVRLDAAGSENLFSQKEAELIRAAYQKIADIFETKDHFAPAIFRIGHGGEPGARSLRKPPEIAFK